MLSAKRIDWTGDKQINLALQGGGSHGAFTWGVLDAILEDGRLDIEAISGTSAGAMNAVAYAQGYLENGRDGAREALEKFWASVCESNVLTLAQQTVFDRYFGAFHYDSSPFATWIDFVSKLTSPYQLNPLNINPLRSHLESMIDFDKVRACEHIKLFVSATNVHTGKIAVFERETLTPDHVMASACLPMLFQAVEIDGVPYWDGGYMGNPALFPLYQYCHARDIVIVQINPIERRETPRTMNDIQNRLNEITFNSAMLGELRAIDFVNRLIEADRVEADEYVRLHLHRIGGGDDIAMFSEASKLDTRWSFLTNLRDLGRKHAGDWLQRHYDHIGKRSTLGLSLDPEASE